MKANKHLHLLTLLLFLFQTAFPPALLSQTSTPQDHGAPAAVRSVDDLFDASVSGRERQLLFEFVQYVISSFPSREGLRTASEELHKNLKNDQFWFSLNIGDQGMADLLAEANAGRRYLIEKTIPVETRLHAEQRRLEKLLIADHERIASTGIVPDGFMERTRGLAYLYDLQDDLWEMKIALLFKIGALSNNVVNNYLSNHPEQLAPIRDRITESNAFLDAIAGFAAEHNRQLVALKARFQDARNAYNAATVSALSDERVKTVDMVDVIRRQSETIGRQRDANSRHHAEMLNLINQSLQDRIARIDQQLGKFGATDAFPNPLYIAPGLGASDESRPLAEAYRGIARKLIHQTHRKAAEVKQLKAILADIQRTMGQEHIFFQTLVGETDGIPLGNKPNITAKSNAIVSGFVDSLKVLESDLDRIIGMADGLDFEKPDVIIGSQSAAAAAFRLNREIEKFVLSAGDLEQTSLGVDVQLYALLSGMNATRAEQLKSYEMLEKTSLTREQAVKTFSQKLATVQEIVDADALLARDLKKVGRDIISRGQAFFKSKTETLSELLAQNQSATGRPYFDFLTGAKEQLEIRLGVIEKMASLSKDMDAPPAGQTPCRECPPAATVWPELAELGTSYTDALQQLDDLADIESFYSQDNINSDNRLSDVRNLFALSKRLGSQPFLHLNPDGIDVVFTAGSRLTVIKNIGNPAGMDFTDGSMGFDYLMQPPYIGGWLSSTISSIGSNWVQPISQAVYNTASDVVSTAVEVGGKIGAAAGQVAQTVYEGAQTAVEAVGEFGSDMWTVTKDWAGNTWANAVKNDDGSYSWLKIAGYALGGTACVIAAVGTAGLAAPACIALAIAAGVNVAQGWVDTAAMPEYGMISKETADWLKLGLDVAGIVAGGWVNFKNAGAAWSKMGKLSKLMTLMGMSPDDLKNIKTLWPGKWLSWEKTVDALSAWRNIPDWYYKFQDWYGRLPSLSTIGSGISGLLNTLPGAGGFGTGTGFIHNLMGPGLSLPGLNPFGLGFDPFSPFGMGSSMFGGAGTLLPGAGSMGIGGIGGIGGSAPGVSLGPGSAPSGGSWTMPGTTSSTFVNPYANWKNPYADWKNPYADWVSPY